MIFDHGPVAVQWSRMIGAIITSVGRLRGSMVLTSPPSAGQIAKPGGAPRILVLSYN